MVISPLSRVVPLPNGRNGLYMGVTNHLLAGMILQVNRFQQSEGGHESIENHPHQSFKQDSLYGVQALQGTRL